MANEKPSVSPVQRAHPTAPELPADMVKEFGIVHRADEPVPAATPSPLALGDDAKTDAAVEDIVAKESDELLEAEDAARSANEPVKRRGFFGSIGHFFSSWAHNTWARWTTFLVIIIIAAAVTAVPKARYFVLNTVGVRSSINVTVVDDGTQLPLKNVKVTVAGEQVLTDVQGMARVSGLKLGQHKLHIERLAFTSVNREVTVGWGSNPLGTLALRATGLKYVIQVTDYLSGKPLAGAQAESGELNAVSDKDGKITLAVNDTKDLPVRIMATGFRAEALTLTTANLAANAMTLVPSQKAVFISKQSGTYDLYSMDIDGKDRKVILKGTGSENSNISLSVSPSGQLAALVSTRDNVRGKDGYLLSAITLVDVSEGSKLTIEHVEQVKLIDWDGDRIIYQTTTTGPSGATPQRNRLISYDYSGSSRIQLAAANQFNTVISSGGSIYYAPSSTDPNASLGLVRIKPDGSGKTSLFTKEVWTGIRSAYAELYLQTPDGWYAYAFDDQQPEKTSNTPNSVSRQYSNAPKESKSLWVDSRDGKGVLLSYDLLSRKDTVVAVGDGLTYPIRWLNDTTVMYRQSSNAETADYALSLKGGAARKVADVTSTYGLAQGY